MNLYTRTGDDGTTGLFGGQRVGKDDPRVVAYGTVDELNCMVGLAVTGCGVKGMDADLMKLQSRLFDLGADLATPADAKDAARAKVARINTDDVAELEAMIDHYSQQTPAMRAFVLPGGTELAARLHVARSVARRAERWCVTLARQADVGPHVGVYLNRVSDLLFAMARYANHAAGAGDVPWAPKQP